MRILITILLIAVGMWAYSNLELIPPHGEARDHTINTSDCTLLRVGSAYYCLHSCVDANRRRVKNADR